MKVEQRAAESRSKAALSDKAALLKLYREMLLIRRFEEKTAEMYQAAKIGGFCHLNIGEEATIVGTISALRPADYVYSTYREPGHTGPGPHPRSGRRAVPRICPGNGATAWTCSPCAASPPSWSPRPARSTSRACSSASPIATAATRCRIPTPIAARTRSKNGRR